MSENQSSENREEKSNYPTEGLTLKELRRFTIELLTVMGSLIAIYILIIYFMSSIGWLDQEREIAYLKIMLFLFPIPFFMILYDYRRRRMEIFSKNKREKNREELDNPEHYFEKLVKINVDNLSEYYQMAEYHSARSFAASLIASIIGFVLIVMGLVIGFRNQPGETLSYITTGGGLIIEVVAGLFFYLYNRTVIQLKGYHDKLIHVQNVLLYFKVLDDIKDDLKDEATQSVAKEMLPLAQAMLPYLVATSNPGGEYNVEQSGPET